MADTGPDNPQQISGSRTQRAGSEGPAESVSPEFNHEALAHLQVQADEIFLHVQLFVDRDSERNRRQLVDYLQRFRNTLVLLEKIAAIYVVEELLTLMQADSQGKIGNRSELARVLATAADHLCEYVATLHQDTSVDSALPLLPLVNDSRACREESLLSDTIVLAAGIELPSARQADLTDGSWVVQRNRWVDFASSHHSAYARGLLGWWRSGEVEAIRSLAVVLRKFAKLCAQYDYLQVIEPLYQSAAIVAIALEERELDDGPALRSMFAQLERNIHRSTLIETPDDLLPGDLLRNFLYYVAQTESTSRSALDLRRQFRLDRIREAALVNQSSMTPTIGVGYHLATAIRAGIANETVSLHSWLHQPASELAKPKIIRLLVRLVQLEPVLSLMGEAEALACLQLINKQLQQLQTETHVSHRLKHSLGQSLQQLDELLDHSARRSITRGAGTVDTATVDGGDVFVDMATDALIREARSSLRIASDDLALLFVNPENTEVSYAGIATHLMQINNALQILPLPEIDALVSGLCDLLKRCEPGGRLGKDLTAAALINNEINNEISNEIDNEIDNESHSLPLAASANEDHFEADTVEQEIARLLVSIDFYLGCVLQPQPAASQLLLRANDALDCARARFEGALQPVINPDAESAVPMADILASMQRLGESLQTNRANPESASIIGIHLALSDYRQTTARDPDSQHAQLAASAEAWFARIASNAEPLSHDHLCLLDEVHALIPQLADKSSGESGPVPAFDELLQQLQDSGTSVAAPESYLEQAEDTFSESEFEMATVDATSDSWFVDLPESDVNSLTLNVDDELLKAPRTPPTEASLDNTLQYVFYSESLGHLENLEQSVRKALQPSADNSNRLPNEQMLRALHTLTSSAQTVDAQEILAIVQPLQKASLVRQRLELSFDASQTRYIGDLAMALRARLDSLNSGKEVGQSVKAVEQKLRGFIDSVAPGNAEDTQFVQLDPIDETDGSAVSLDDVFAEEANELLDKLRDLASLDGFDQNAVDESLGLLHTLKGGARMVGKTGISQTAHDLEAEIQQMTSIGDQKAAIKSGYQAIQAQLRQSVDRKLLSTRAAQEAGTPVLADKKSDGMLVSDTAFDGLLDLATDLTTNQARLSEELAVLREAYQDISATSRRWQNLSRSGSETSTDQNEMRADLESAVAVLRSSLRQAEREQQTASRSSTTLLQNLIRTRLVRVDEIQGRLNKTIQDACEARGVSANLVFEGGEITLDRVMFKRLAAPLEHVARNAVVHGVEPAEHRLALGKPAAGVLTLSASIDGTDLVIKFKDDGRGIDREALSRQMVSDGQSAILTHEELQQALFSSGFSSVEHADSLAGHGLGLAAVKVVTDQLGGQVQLSTDTRVGTEITLRLPQRIVVNQVVLVSSGGLLYAVPVGFVDSVLVDGIAPENSDQYESLILDELLSHSQLQVPAHATGSSKRIGATVIVNVRDKQLALQIDRVVGYRELLIQALGPQMSSLNRFSGGSVLPDGRQVLILDLVKLAESMDPQSAPAIAPPRESLRPVALIVDDSLTMRVASETVLRRCGIAVRLARDGVEALESVANAMPNLIIVDLEMPRMDGMSLLQQLRDHYGQACPPLIIISSRDDSQNRRHSEELGVIRFLAKPFTESALLEAIEAAGLRIPDLTIA